MTTTAGGHRPADPAATARDGVEAAVRPVLGGRRDVRSQAGLIAVAVIAITVVAAGIGLGGRGIEPSPSTSPSGPDPSRLATSTSPAPSRRTRPPATEMPGSVCVPADAADLPEIRLWSTLGNTPFVRGVEGPPDWALSSPPTAAWPTPERSLVLERSAAIVLVPDEGACIRYATAEYLGVEDLGGVPEALALGEINVDPPRSRVVLGSPPQGDWIMRVVAHFSVGAAGDDDVAVIERFFRVQSSGAPYATPYITPAVDCGDLLAGAALPRLSLVAGAGEPVLGVDMTTYPGDILHNGALVTGAFPDPIELRIEGDACATSWNILMVDPVSGEIRNAISEFNPTESLTFIAQNRIVFSFTPLGRSVVQATVTFGKTREARAAWELSVSGPPPPAAVVVGARGGEATARPGCGTSWTLAATSAFELCTTQAVPETLDVLTVRSGETVSLELPGWDLTSWWVGCGERSTDSSVIYQPIAECGLGGNGDGTGPAGPVRFIPFPGRTIVAIYVSASRGADSVGAQYYVEVDVRP
jgi:hypothetical protein